MKNVDKNSGTKKTWSIIIIESDPNGTRNPMEIFERKFRWQTLQEISAKNLIKITRSLVEKLSKIHNYSQNDHTYALWSLSRWYIYCWLFLTEYQELFTQLRSFFLMVFCSFDKILAVLKVIFDVIKKNKGKLWR